ncbi:predicted protein [Plenodomus lingam JN3]|uniref:Predicted protein n=1 Tax=Leptosphaeria maculans (strain JN3 / isolate v23.1.3 / race Av1-4-5-6-7-8) TaxID=985895 RepID=E4ZRP1_LEPMJ|nr:predicted protein [Plenodomus lingam JN3]CBX93888.1 predicted protein [Plenodomus lingam JN3]
MQYVEDNVPTSLAPTVTATTHLFKVPTVMRTLVSIAIVDTDCDSWNQGPRWSAHEVTVTQQLKLPEMNAAFANQHTSLFGGLNSIREKDTPLPCVSRKRLEGGASAGDEWAWRKNRLYMGFDQESAMACRNKFSFLFGGRQETPSKAETLGAQSEGQPFLRSVTSTISTEKVDRGSLTLQGLRMLFFMFTDEMIRLSYNSAFGST